MEGRQFCYAINFRHHIISGAAVYVDSSRLTVKSNKAINKQAGNKYSELMAAVQVCIYFPHSLLVTFPLHTPTPTGPCARLFCVVWRVCYPVCLCVFRVRVCRAPPVLYPRCCVSLRVIWWAVLWGILCVSCVILHVLFCLLSYP